MRNRANALRVGLYAIVDDPNPHGLSVIQMTQAVLGDRLEGGKAGASVVQLRAKGATTVERRSALEAMAPLCARAQARLIVNDDLGAVVPGVSGIHLGQTDPGADDLESVRTRLSRGVSSAPGQPNKPSGGWVGLSTHDLAQLRNALRQRPDYVAFGPVLRTRSKHNPDPTVGFDELTQACRVSNVPLVAIGGLDSESGSRAMEVGAAWVAVISALHGATASEVRQRAEDLSREFAQAGRPRSLDEVANEIPVFSKEQLRDFAEWSDSLGMHIELGLPARFRPRMDGGEAWFRPSDVVDLKIALGKKDSETWDQWRSRAASGEVSGGLVQIRRA